MMEKAFPIRKIWYLLTITWVAFGLISHLSAILWMIQYQEELSLYKVFDVGFYYYTPALLWLIYTPVIIRIYLKRPLSDKHWKQNLFFHIVLSTLFAPIARILAIFVDYSIKYLVNMAIEPPWVNVYLARYIVLGSAPRAFLFYWIIIGTVITWDYFKIRAGKNVRPKPINNPERIAVPFQGGKKIIEIKDIWWIAANKNYVNIHTADECFRYRQSLAKFQKTLAPQYFFQIHRSTIVNSNFIASLNHWRRGEYLIKMKNDKLLYSSRTYHDNVKAILSKNSNP